LTAKQGLFIDTTKMGRVAIREPLSMRIGYANDDLTETCCGSSRKNGWCSRWSVPPPC